MSPLSMDTREYASTRCKSFSPPPPHWIASQLHPNTPCIDPQKAVYLRLTSVQSITIRYSGHYSSRYCRFTYIRKCCAVRGSAIAVAIAVTIVGVRTYESVPLFADRYSGGYSGYSEVTHPKLIELRNA